MNIYLTHSTPVFALGTFIFDVIYSPPQSSWSYFFIHEKNAHYKVLYEVLNNIANTI